jgi:hypothetical protein
VQVFKTVPCRVVGKEFMALKLLVSQQHHSAMIDLHMYFGIDFIHQIVAICWLVVFLFQVVPLISFP